MLRFITLSLITLLSFLLQTALFSFHNLIGMAPDLVMIVTMSFGIMRGRKEGLLVGVLGGFLMDIFYTDHIGMYMLIYMIIGYTNGLVHRSYLMEDIMLPVIVTILDSLGINFVIYIFSFLLRNKTSFSSYFTSIILPQMLLSVLVTLILYRILVLVNKGLKKKPKKRKTTTEVSSI